MIWFFSIGIFLIIVEMLTPSIFFFLAFGIAFLLNSVVYYFTNSLPISLITTGVTAIVIFYYLKKSNIFKFNKTFTSNISSYIGKSCVVEELLPNNLYRIKLYSEVWTGKSEDKLSVGDSCKVIDRKDNTLIIKKQ